MHTYVYDPEAHKGKEQIDPTGRRNKSLAQGYSVPMQSSPLEVNVWEPWEIEALKYQRRHMGHHRPDKGRKDNIRWFGVPGGVAEVETLRRKGWPEGVKKAREKVGDIGELPMLRSYRRVRRFRNFGDEIRIERVYGGDLNRAWETREREARSGISVGVVRIVVCIGGNFGMRADQLFYRGATAIMLADALERAGISTDIIAYTNDSDLYIGRRGRMSDPRHRMDLIKVKQQGQPLDIDAVAAVICLAGYFRHYIFKAWCSMDEELPGGLGYLCSELIHTEVRPGDIIIRNVDSADSAKEFIKDALADYRKVTAHE